VGPDDFGSVTVAYDVRYSPQGLADAFRSPFDESIVRDTMRKMILAAYLQRGADLAAVGWAYWTGGVYNQWRVGQAMFVKTSVQKYSPIRPFPGVPTPSAVQISRAGQSLLSTLYYIEDDFVAGLRALRDAVADGQRISPSEFERKLSGFGKALDRIDRFADSENGAFAVLDELQRRAAPGAAGLSSLTLTSTRDGQPVTRVFLA